MRILVGVKRVIDYAVKVRVAADHKGVELNNVKMSLNPFCEIALEEAVRIKEGRKGEATEIVALSIGGKPCQETLRTALAMGADRAVHVHTEARTDQTLQPLGVSKIVAHVARQEKSDLVLLGKQSIDGDNSQTGPMTAALLGWPHITFAAKIVISVDNGLLQASVERETDVGTETYSAQLPAVITADLRLNQPRYATLPNIMKAKKKPMEVIDASSLGLDISPRIVVEAVDEPPARPAGRLLLSVDELVGAIKEAAGRA